MSRSMRIKNGQNMKVGGTHSQIICFGPILKTHKRHFRQQSRYTICVAYIDGQWHFMPHKEPSISGTA